MPQKPDDVIDRALEWEALERMWERPRPDLAFVVGRRRVGKSYVLARFARAVGGVYYQATRRTEAEQLAGFSRIVGEHFDDAALRRGVGFPTWEDLFDYVTDRAKGAPFLIVLDEFPYLAEAAPALPSIVQSAWDHRWDGDPDEGRPQRLLRHGDGAARGGRPAALRTADGAPGLRSLRAS